MVAVPHSVIKYIRDFGEECGRQKDGVHPPSKKALEDTIGDDCPKFLREALMFYAWYAVSPLGFDGNSQGRFKRIIEQENPDTVEALKAAYDTLAAHNIINNDPRRHRVMAYLDSLKQTNGE